MMKYIMFSIILVAFIILDIVIATLGGFYFIIMLDNKFYNMFTPLEKERNKKIDWVSDVFLLSQSWYAENFK